MFGKKDRKDSDALTGEDVGLSDDTFVEADLVGTVEPGGAVETATAIDTSADVASDLDALEARIARALPPGWKPPAVREEPAPVAPVPDAPVFEPAIVENEVAPIAEAPAVDAAPAPDSVPVPPVSQPPMTFDRASMPWRTNAPQAPGSEPAPAATEDEDVDILARAETVSISPGYAPIPRTPAVQPVEPAPETAEAEVVEEVDLTPATGIDVVAPDTAPTRRSLLPGAAHDLPSRAQLHQHSADQPQTIAVGETEVVPAGASVLPTLPSRAPARWLAATLTLLLTPVAWYLLADAGVRLTVMAAQLEETGRANPAAMIEFALGLVTLVLIMVLAGQSSLGLILSGSLMLVLGLPFLFAPAWSISFVGDVLGGLAESSTFGSNVVICLLQTGLTGVMTLAGAMMLGAGILVARARRKGRREEASRVMVAANNPSGLKARWAIKATERENGR